MCVSHSTGERKWIDIGALGGGLIAEFFEQQFQFSGAAVNVADDIKRASFGGFVVPERLALDGDAINFIGRAQNVNVAESLALKVADVSSQ